MLIGQVSPLLLRFFRSQCGSRAEAEDLLQDTWLQIHKVRATPMQVALAWLPQRAPNILLIPGTSSVGNLRENLTAATLELPPETISQLDLISRASKTARAD